MLKIKTEKMGELEKFGFFEMGDFWFYGELGDDYYTDEPKFECYVLKDKGLCDEYDTEERVVYTDAGYIPSIVYDLIKADMVEVCDD